jgi:hypothetical protein
LDGLIALEEAGEKVILPVWHDLDYATLVQYSPILAGRLAAKTKEGISEIAKYITRVVFESGDSPSSLHPSLTSRFIELIEVQEGISSIRGFLISHPSILIEAIDYGRLVAAEIDEIPNVGGFSPDLSVMAEISYASVRKLSLLILMSSSDPIFEEDMPAPNVVEKVLQMKSMVKELEAKFSEVLLEGEIPQLSFTTKFLYKIEGIIVAGRSSGLSKEDGVKLRDYNESLNKISIRTYDWLIDASLVAEPLFYRPWYKR